MTLFKREFLLEELQAFQGKVRVSSEPVSILFGDPSSPIIRLNPLMTPITKEAKEALEEHEVAHTAKRSIHLTPGDFLLIDNMKSVHFRSGFKALYDGNDRWLIRAYGKWDWRHMVDNISSDRFTVNAINNGKGKLET